MTSPVWCTTARWLVSIGLVLGLAACRQRPTQTFHDAVRQTESGAYAEQLLAYYFPKSPAKPDELALAPHFKILAPPGWLDRYEPVDLHADRVTRQERLFVRESDGRYRSVTRSEARHATTPVYAYHRAPAIDQFTRDYGIEVEIEHFTAEERDHEGIDASRSAGFDLVLGPRSMLTLVLDRHNLAPFSSGALTRFAAPSIYITETLGRPPADLDLRFCVPYFREAVGIGYNPLIAASAPRHWSEGFRFEQKELYWHRVLLRNNPFVVLGSTLLYQNTLSPEQRTAGGQSTDALLDAVAALAADPDPHLNKAAALQELRRQFAEPADPAANPFGYGVHTAAFTTAEGASFQAKHLRSFALAGSPSRVADSNARADEAARLIKRMIVFGARFIEDNEIPSADMDSRWAYLIGSAGDPYAMVRSDSNFRFFIPDPSAPLELDIFVLPAQRPALHQRTAAFFVDYLLIPEVAASMTLFALKANFVRDSIAFLPVEILNSPIYALPEREDAVYLPILTEDNTHFRELWEDIHKFSQLVQSIDDLRLVRSSNPAAAVASAP